MKASSEAIVEQLLDAHDACHGALQSGWFAALSVLFTFSSEQLPINVQLVSRWLDEATILRLGALIEAGNKAQHRDPNL